MASPDASWPLQQAVYAALAGDATLTALAAGGVHDHVPQDQPFPFVQIGEATVRDWSAKTFDGAEHTLTIHAWARGRGRKGVKEIMARIHEVLHNAALAVTGHTLVLLRFEFADAMEDPDGLTYHGVTRFRAVTQPT